MSKRLMILMVACCLLSSGVAGSMPTAEKSAPPGKVPAAGSSTPAPPPVTAPTLTTQEEDDPAGGRRVRVSTPIVRINDFQGSLTLRLECLHPAGRRLAPNQCIVTVIHRDIEAKYSRQHDTRFQVGVNKTQVFDGKLSSYGTSKEGVEVVEPLIGFWDFSLIKKLAGLQYDKVEFLIEKDRVTVDKGCLAIMQDMVKYFP